MKILIILDDEEKRRQTAHFLRGRGLEVETATNGSQGFSRALSGRFSAVLIDPWTAGWDQKAGVRSLVDARPLLMLVLVAPGADEAAALRREYEDVGQVEVVLTQAELPYQLLSRFAMREVVGRLRRAKIVATLGPASSDEATLRQLLEAGVDVVRLNFSHGDHAGHGETLKRLRAITAESGRHVAVLQDLCGPKIRVGRLAEGNVRLVRGEPVTLLGEPVEGTSRGFSITMPEILDDLVAGDRILLDDGNLELAVEKGGANAVECRVVHGGVLKERKGVNLPGARLSLPGLTSKDREDLEFGISHGVDFVAVSFVRVAAHVLETKRIIAEHGADIQVIAKIEKPEAVAGIEEIMDAADGIMIARGDLGVELAVTRVPHIQRKIIRLARTLGKPVITATQMLESMVERPRPTRAEVADVTKAIEDGTDAVMLSAETASGRYPVLAVETMAAIAAETGLWQREASNPYLGDTHERGLLPAVSQGIAMITDNADISVIAVATRSGRTVRELSKAQPDAALLALSDSAVALRRVCLYHGAYPAYAENLAGEESIVRAAEEAALSQELVRRGDVIAVVWDPEWKGGSTGSFATRIQRVR